MNDSPLYLVGGLPQLPLFIIPAGDKKAGGYYNCFTLF